MASLLERDRLFTERLRAETRALGPASVDVEPGMTVDELSVRVEKLTDL